MFLFRRWFIERKLERVETRLKRNHALQRQLRQEMSALEEERRKGGVPSDRYEQEVRSLEARRAEITREVGELMGHEERLKQDLKGPGA